MAERRTVQLSRPSDRVTAPILKFAIGFVATLCATIAPRLLAALGTRDSANVTFITLQWTEFALILALLVGLVISIFEWRVPRAPRDTFMTTLGIPAILAGALSANSNAGELQNAIGKANELADTLSKESGITIEPKVGSPETGRQGALTDFLMPPVYAASAEATIESAEAQGSLAIRVRQPRYLIVLDRAATRQDADAKASQLSQRLAEGARSQPLSVLVQPRGGEFLVVVAGGARVKADAMLEAVRVKNTYHLSPTLVEVPATY